MSADPKCVAHGSVHMTWPQALALLRQGHGVQRAAYLERHLLGTVGGAPVYCLGREPVVLVAAWTDHQSPVFVFQGLYSKTMVIPDPADMQAEDWVLAGQ